MVDTQSLFVANSAAAALTGTASGGMFSTGSLFVISVLVGVMGLTGVVGVVTSRQRNRAGVRMARARGRHLQELLRTVRLAETIAGIGVWQYDPATQMQQWSDGLKRLFGMEHDEPFVEGDAETILFANEIDLIEQVNSRAEESATFVLKFNICGYDGIHRAISVHACNMRNMDGVVDRVIAVVRDETDQVERERVLETSREIAISEAENARILAETDALTGLANRRRVMNYLDRVVMQAREAETSMVLVMFDIDHFKQVNDTHGHPQGDRVLQRVAQIASDQACGSDLVGRVGGEEFVWVVANASEKQVRIMAERLRQAVARASGIGQIPPVTISIGYADMQQSDTALSLFARADGALYDAKHSGRNRVRMAA